MKELRIKFTDGSKQITICEDYEIKNGCLYLIRVSEMDGRELKKDKFGKILMIHNMDSVENIVVEWLN